MSMMERMPSKLEHRRESATKGQFGSRIIERIRELEEERGDAMDYTNCERMTLEEWNKTPMGRELTNLKRSL